ncbi:hypothetical protein [Tabrizicola flagellatus]|uniref:hypothetical protein n=1 Tax=Tabrizicola flagellatus TaxID=2593021 RepID=UPI0011F3817B|nr:hypothetical protein [Tabrizicola flagellatus]
MERLDSLLDAVAAALTAGDFVTLSELAPQVEAISLAAEDARLAEPILAKARRNARLIEAAGRGVRAARLRLSEITQGRELTTYNARGQKAQITVRGAERTYRV